jgi:hypothetical protein
MEVSMSTKKYLSLQRLFLIGLILLVVPGLMLVLVSARTAADIRGVSVQSNSSAEFLTARADTQQRERRPAQIEVELVTVLPHGFEPREISRAPGRFILMIEDRSRLRSLNLELKRDDGPRVRQISITREQPDWNEPLDLEPGRYALSDATNPRWSCVITISR